MRKQTSTNFHNQKILEMSCGLSYAVVLITGRWKVNILWYITKGFNRYGQLKRNIEGISEKMLTQRLKDLEKDGLLTRRDFGTVPPHVEYHLTETSQALIPVLEGLCEWGNKAKKIRDTEKTA